MKVKKVLVSGHFNILHPGHLRLLRFAKNCGTHLIVAIYSDKISGEAAHVPEKLRLEGLESNSWVNEAFIINESITNVIDRIRPDIVVKGKEHENSYNAELATLESYGGQLLFSSGETIFSSLDLLRKEFYDPLDKTILNLPDDYFFRHDILPNRLKEILKIFQKLKVCVIGDFIADEYITCQPLGMSQEDPTIVVTPIDSTRFIGGAGIVAAHGAGLGAEVHFISITGLDSTMEFAKNELEKAGVNSYLIEDDSRPTTLKQRYRSKGKTLLRVSHLHQNAINIKLQDQVFEQVESVINQCNLLIFSDFNYGCLPQPLVDRIINLANSKGVMMAADSQSSSQMGDISRFHSMSLITPTEREARLATRNHEDGLVIMAEKLRQMSSANNVLLKLGEEGLLIHANIENGEEWLTDRIGALNSSPKDVAGAGDSLLIASALTLACGGNIWEAALMGSLAAAIQVSRVGNTPLKASEFLYELEAK